MDRLRRSPELMIAVSAGAGSFSSQFWSPFLPFFLLTIGATSDGNALFWYALALAGQGIGRIIGGPIWGVIADRYGRKLMFVRALYASSLTTFIAGIATTPWHVVVSLSIQGALGGFIPAATTLTSVTVPRRRLGGALATVTAAQYLGTTLGPGLGAALAGIFGLRGAILAGALPPALLALLVTIAVPRDSVEPRQQSTGERRWLDRRRFAGLGNRLSGQLALALFLYFVLYATNQVLRVGTPISIKSILHGSSRTAATGAAFTAAGLGSVVGAIGLARVIIRPPYVRISIAVVLILTAAAHVLLAVSSSVVPYIVWFGVIAVAQGTMIPATNTLIAASVNPAWRGTAFGFASSMQAAAFIVGPMAAAAFATFSLSAGYVAIGGLFLITAAVLFKGLKEPDLAEP